MQNHATDQLYIKGAKTKNSLGSLPHNSKCFGEDGVEGFPGARALLQRGGAGAEFGVGER
jgi:hypothetical protein